ncbi:LSU ribosomal protein L25p [Patulibacter medicamentivorans]|uniref:Large ribosomal subunit protein bL25 n=1 Tax=Patulibacter medicamentivorans TaxID=1097667 RepID=H0E932_9ACTN|nr:50S ribosomal protein L25 [Patulibacter medicamentivorans]EHN09810.1 LSU ribosomal protein L25p [Patulibacter medicamentivorans]
MATNSSSLAVESRDPQHSRDARRTRRTGQVPGVIYGGDLEPQPIVVDARTLRHTLAAAGAVIDLSIDGASTTQPVILKDAQRHPVRGEIMHIDLLRVDLKQAIQQPVTLELTDVDEAAGVREGGVVEQLLREVTVEALPNEIPESISLSILDLGIGHNLTLAEAVVPAGVTIVDDAETVVVSISAPRVVVEAGAEGEEGAAAEASADAPAESAGGDEAAEESAGE